MLENIETACKLVAETYYGERGAWLYQAFEAINAQLFSGELPYPLITIEITPHSGCLGWCSCSDIRPARIAIHPTLFGVRSKGESVPWGVPGSWLGKRFAFEALLHECMHASVHYRLGGFQGPSSHNNDAWIGEVNRIAPVLGFHNVVAGRQVAKRVAIPGEFTNTGKPATKVQKVSLGNIPISATAMFPLGLREHYGSAESFYKLGRLPSKCNRTRWGCVTRSWKLQKSQCSVARSGTRLRLGK